MLKPITELSEDEQLSVYLMYFKTRLLAISGMKYSEYKNTILDIARKLMYDDAYFESFIEEINQLLSANIAITSPFSDKIIYDIIGSGVRIKSYSLLHKFEYTLEIPMDEASYHHSPYTQSDSDLTVLYDMQAVIDKMIEKKLIELL